MLLGCGVCGPAYVIQHELLVRRGALFTTSVSRAVPISVQLCTEASVKRDLSTRSSSPFS